MATLAEISCKPYWAKAEVCGNGAMKELKMFPQITEETEENLLNLEEGRSSPSPPSSRSSSSAEPASPGHENQVPCQLPIITTEDADCPSTAPASPTQDAEFAPPLRVRMRSLSGGAYRLAPTLPVTQGRTRRQSGDDVLSPSRRAALFEHFRPRSKSDSKGKRPTFLTSLKNSLFSGNSGAQRKNSLEAEPTPLEPLQPDYRQRPRSGSETRGGTMSKMIDLFRSRSNSVSVEPVDRKLADTRKALRNKKPAPIFMAPANALLRRHSVDPDTRRRLGKTYRALDGHLGETSFPGHADDDASDNRIDYAALDDDQIIPMFLNSHCCYHAMSKSGKVIILTTDLLIKNAFSSLLVNEIRSAPLWDSLTHSFVGILTITDFINVLRHYHYSALEDIHAIEDQQIITWRRLTNVEKPFIKIGPCDNLKSAANLLIQEGVHRLPVYDEKMNSVLFLLTRRRLLQYLHQNLLDKFESSNVKTPSFMKKSVGELRIGTYENIAVVSPETRVIEALDIFMARNISSLPVVENSKLIDIFAKFDVFALAKEQTYHNLNICISEALNKAGVHEEICACMIDEPLESVIYKFVTCKVHRVVVIDEEHSVIGMISLSDVLRFLVEPIDEPAAAANDTIEEEGGADQELKSNEPEPSSTDRPDLCEDLGKLQLETVSSE